MSLQRISLRDFVIVRQLDLDFSQGFGVLSGETGAGKSILVDALQLVLGARADASVVREGASRTEISAEFALNPSLQSWLEDNGFEAHDDLLLKRSIDAQGKSRAWINGSAATATQLREIGDTLYRRYTRTDARLTPSCATRYYCTGTGGTRAQTHIQLPSSMVSMVAQRFTMVAPRAAPLRRKLS